VRACARRATAAEPLVRHHHAGGFVRRHPHRLFKGKLHRAEIAPSARNAGKRHIAMRRRALRMRAFKHVLWNAVGLNVLKQRGQQAFKLSLLTLRQRR